MRALSAAEIQSERPSSLMTSQDRELAVVFPLPDSIRLLVPINQTPFIELFLRRSLFLETKKQLDYKTLSLSLCTKCSPPLF